jgi:hypothetical protein
MPLPGNIGSIGYNLWQRIERLHSNLCHASVPEHPLLCIVPKCMPSHHMCQQPAVVVNNGVFGRFHCSIQIVMQNIKPIDLSCSGNQLTIAMVEVLTVVICQIDFDVFVPDLTL